MFLSLALIALAPPVQPVAVDRPSAIVEAVGKFSVVKYQKGGEYKVQFPIPREAREQVPIAFDLTTKPGDGIASSRLTVDPLGNVIVELTLKPQPDGKAVEIEWKSTVLMAEVGHIEKFPTTAPFPDRFPDAVKPWLSPSKYVQSDDKRIQDAAKRFLDKDVMQTIWNTLDGCRTILGNQSGRCKTLSSVEALTLFGSCVSNANLMAALLRANGVPARIWSCYPTKLRQALQTHYIVEAYIPGWDWFALESSACTGVFTPSDTLLVALASVEAENQGGTRSNVAVGVPYLTLNECPAGTYTLGQLEPLGCAHQSRIKSRGKASEAVWTDARKAWAEWLKRPAGAKLTLEQTVPPLKK